MILLLFVLLIIIPVVFVCLVLETRFTSDELIEMGIHFDREEAR